MQPSKWYMEAVTPELKVLYSVRNVLHSSKTAYQHVEILDTGPFGRSLVLDNKTQSTEADEHIYHEALVHPVLLAHPSPHTVFIAGGGEGATLREALAHKSVKKAVMVDIDSEVVELCKRFLPHHHLGSFEDPRAKLVIDDARAFLASNADTYDTVILDLADPIEAGPAYKLYTEEFYRLVRQRLNPGGMVVTQSGPAGPLNYRECFTAVANTMQHVFGHVLSYTVYVPSFAGVWGFTMAGTSPLLLPTPAEIDRRIKQRLARPLRYYDGLTHLHLFTLPRYIRDGLAEEQRTIADARPLFII